MTLGHTGWGFIGFLCLSLRAARPSAADSDISLLSSLPPQYRPSKIRSLQENPSEICFRKESEVFFFLSAAVTQNPNASRPEEYPVWYPMDFVEECMSSILINGTNMINHLESIQRVFEQYGSFTNVAKNPSETFPNDHQAELGYTIFDDENGTPGGGQVDLDAEIDAMVRRISEEGTASFVNFWDLNTLLNRYYDAHIEPPFLRSDAGLYGIRMVPATTLLTRDSLEGFLGDSEALPTYRAEFTLEENTLQLDVVWNETTTKRVSSMNGVPVHDFYKALVDGTAKSSSPLAAAALRLQYQTPGARLNHLLQNGGLINRDYMFIAGFFGTPSDIFPLIQNSTILVNYSDDNGENLQKTEEWKVMVSANMMNNFNALVNPSGSIDERFVTLDFEAAELFINQPGEFKAAFLQAMDGLPSVEDIGSDRRLVAGKKDTALGESTGIAHLRDFRSVKDTSSKQPRSLQEITEATAFDWDMLFLPDESGIFHAACRVEEDHAVFKFDTFGDAPPLVFCALFGIPEEGSEFLPSGCREGVADAYMECARAAKEKGVVNLIFDISDNVGGNVVQLIRLLVVMVPSIPDDYFDRWFDANLNDEMEAFTDISQGTVVDFVLSLQSITASDIEVTINDITEAELDQILLASRALVNLCESGRNSFCFKLVELEGRATTLSELVRGGVAISSATSAAAIFPEFLGAISCVVQALGSLFNPWSVSILDALLVQQLMTQGPVEKIQGGRSVRNTQPFLAVVGPELVSPILATSRSDRESILGDFAFEHVAILSNGVSVSASAILYSGLSQLWKNRDRSGMATRVTTVSFGGTGSADDASMASVPASIQEIALENNLIAAGLFGVLARLVPRGFPGYESIVEAIAEYEETVAVPPYFAATLPLMPVWAYYDYFMGPSPSEALPLQYVKIPPDGYVPEIFAETSISNGGDLSALYRATADQYLLSTDAPSGGVNSTEAPTAVPSRDDSNSNDDIPSSSGTPSTAGIGGWVGAIAAAAGSAWILC